MTGPEILGGGRDRGRAARPRAERLSTAARRRWTGLAGTVLVGVAAVMLAARSLPEPTPPAAPAPTVLAPVPDRFVADVAVGTAWAYALGASCLGPETTRQCTYRLLRRSITGGPWTTTALETAAVAGAVGPPRLFVTGDDLVTVVDQPTVGTVHVSPDGGETASRTVLRPGAPIAAVPDGEIVDLALCESCLDRLTVLEPRTGRLRPLATPPPFGPTLSIRSVAESGGVLWVLGDGGSRLISAVSVDQGRSWRKLPVGGARTPAQITRLVSDGGLGAYLMIGRDARPDVHEEFSELWRIGDPTRPGAAWRQVTPAVRPRSAAGVVVGARGLIVWEETGALWRVQPNGTMGQLPPVVVDGVLVAVRYLVSGPGQVMLAMAENPSELGLPTVLLSADGGTTWRVQKIPL